MRKLFLPALSALFLLFTGCKEDFDIAAPYKDVTFVYAMLDVNDTINYVRIQKAFMDQGKSSIDMSKIPDSSYHIPGTIDVSIKELSKATGALISTSNLILSTVAPKEPGMFFTEPNKAYPYHKRLSILNTYRLIIRNIETGEVDSAETELITNDSTSQQGFFVLAFGTTSTAPFDISFARTAAVSDKYSLSVKVPAPARILEGIIKFSYWERDNINADVRKFIDFPFATALVENSNANLVVPNSAFYSFFREKLGEAPPNVVRFLDSNCSIEIYASTDDFYQYQTITAAQMTGITSNEIKPMYTNLKGNDVYGLFTTRALRRGVNLPIAKLTFDSLANNSITRPTGLQDEPYRP